MGDGLKGASPFGMTTDPGTSSPFGKLFKTAAPRNTQIIMPEDPSSQVKAARNMKITGIAEESSVKSSA